jgi:molybdopterin molybdotransferase
VGWTVIGSRIAERLAGLSFRSKPKIVAKAGQHLSRRPGRCEFRPARIVGYDASGAQIVGFMSDSYSARIKQLLDADGLVLIPAGETEIKPGRLLEFLPS